MFGQGAQARDKLVDKLLESVEIPVPAAAHRRRGAPSPREREPPRGRRAPRRGRRVASEKTFRSQILLDAIAETEKVKVSQDELTQYLVQGAAQYSMEPSEFVKVLDENGQIPAMVGEVARDKALAIVLGKAKVVDTKGKPVDLSEFTASAEKPRTGGTEYIDVPLDTATTGDDAAETDAPLAEPAEAAEPDEK